MIGLVYDTYKRGFMRNIIYLTIGIAKHFINLMDSEVEISTIPTSVLLPFYFNAIHHLRNYAVDADELAQLQRMAINNDTPYQFIHTCSVKALHRFGAALTCKDPALVSRLMETLNIDPNLLRTRFTEVPWDTNTSDHMPSDTSQPSMTGSANTMTNNTWEANALEAKELKEHLDKTFFGQSTTVAELLNSVAHRSLRQRIAGPRQSYFMIGPSGTGKTHLAEQLAIYYQSQKKFGIHKIDMSSISNETQQFELIGLTSGYSEAQPGGLTNFISKHPDGCVVILDNLDKAHPNCQGVLLEAFDTGYLTDKYQPDAEKKEALKPVCPNPVDCRNTIFIITSNAHAEFIESTRFQKMIASTPSAAKRTVIDKLATLKTPHNGFEIVQFQSDLLARLNAHTVLLFQPLKFTDLMRIAQKQYAETKAILEKELKLTIREENLETCLYAGLLKIGHKLNARRVGNAEFTDMFFDLVLQTLQATNTVNTVRLTTDDGFKAQIESGLMDISENKLVRELFRKGRYLDFDVRVQQNKRQLCIILEKPVWKKATRSEDVCEGGMLAMEIPDICFDDIKGHQYAKDKFQEIVKLLKNPSSMSEYDIDPPKGLLLYGEPGTGKTMLAKALANEADLPFLSCTGPDLLQSPNYLQSIYKTARHYAPSIVFIDEIDILGDRSRGGFSIVINQLLAEIDGFSDSEERVFTVAATNYPERLDPAIVRSGRIELKIHVPKLDKEARRNFLLKIKALQSGVNLDIEALLDDTAGMTGAEMEQIQRGIGMHLIKHGGTEITTELAEDIIAIIRYGEKTGVTKDEWNRRRIAIHEAGHAIVAMSLKPIREIERITIASRGSIAGFVKFNEDQRLIKTPQHVRNEMAIGLGGRCAQIMCDAENGLDEGASNDLEIVTQYAYYACTAWGFDDQIGWISLPTAHNELALTGLQAKVNERVAVWINEAKTLAMDVLTKNRQQHLYLVEMLLKDETLMPEEFELIKKTIV
jgi:cell division protease FtsH